MLRGLSSLRDDGTFDGLLASRILPSAELSQLSARELIVLRAKVRAEILSNPEIVNQLTKVASGTISDLRKGKGGKVRTSKKVS